jgi:hypothetical protein
MTNRMTGLMDRYLTVLFVQGVDLLEPRKRDVGEPVVEWLLNTAKQAQYVPPDNLLSEELDKVLRMALTRWEFPVGKLVFEHGAEVTIRRYWPDWCLQVEVPRSSGPASDLVEEIHAALEHLYFSPPLHLEVKRNLNMFPNPNGHLTGKIGSAVLFRTQESYIEGIRPKHRAAMWLLDPGDMIRDEVLNLLLIIEYDLRVIYKDLVLLYASLRELRHLSDQLAYGIGELCRGQAPLEIHGDITRVHDQATALGKRANTIASDVFTSVFDLYNFYEDLQAKVETIEAPIRDFYGDQAKAGYQRANLIAGEVKSLIERAGYLIEGFLNGQVPETRG